MAPSRTRAPASPPPPLDPAPAAWEHKTTGCVLLTEAQQCGKRSRCVDLFNLAAWRRMLCAAVCSLCIPWHVPPSPTILFLAVIHYLFASEHLAKPFEPFELAREQASRGWAGRQSRAGESKGKVRKCCTVKHLAQVRGYQSRHSKPSPVPDWKEAPGVVLRLPLSLRSSRRRPKPCSQVTLPPVSLSVRGRAAVAAACGPAPHRPWPRASSCSSLHDKETGQGASAFQSSLGTPPVWDTCACARGGAEALPLQLLLQR